MGFWTRVRLPSSPLRVYVGEPWKVADLRAFDRFCLPDYTR